MEVLKVVWFNTVIGVRYSCRSVRRSTLQSSYNYCCSKTYPNILYLHFVPFFSNVIAILSTDQVVIKNIIEKQPLEFQ